MLQALHFLSAVRKKVAAQLSQAEATEHFAQLASMVVQAVQVASALLPDL